MKICIDDERIKEQRKYRAARNAGDNVGEMKWAL